MKFNLTNKRCLITGATHGIGKEITKKLLESGATVYGCSLGNHLSSISEFNNEKFIHIKCDVSKQSELEVLTKTINNDIDILINNAGGGGRWGSSNWLETELSVWEEVYSKNVEYIIYLLKSYLPSMIKNDWGRVVTISSVHGKERGGRPWFQIAKSAQISLMKSFSSNQDYVTHNITFNTVCPGHIYIEDTGLETLKNTSYDEFIKLQDSLPRKSFGTPEEVANLVLFLCSNDASLINGSCITADGGESKSL